MQRKKKQTKVYIIFKTMAEYNKVTMTIVGHTDSLDHAKMILSQLNGEQSDEKTMQFHIRESSMIEVE